MEYYLAFIFGLFGSLHCLGMCGPIVMAYTVPLTRNNATRKIYLFVPHVLYNTGRIITYSLMGALAGGIGSRLFHLSFLLGIERASFIIIGIILLVVGLILAKVVVIPQKFSQHFNSKLTFLQSSIKQFLGQPTWSSKLLLGFLMGFLPCHLIYAMLLQAVVTGSVQKGALIMFSFGFGTFPALLFTGFFSNILSSTVRKWGDSLLVFGVLTLAVMLLFRGIGYDLFSFCHMNVGDTSCPSHHQLN